MSVFHVIVSLESSGNELEEILSDLTVDELKVKFVTPYRKGEDLVLANRVLRINQICKVHIVQTEAMNSVVRGELNKADLESIDTLNRNSSSVFIISPGRGYEPLDILDGGKDVTAEFIEGPPGYSRRSGWAQAFLNNQWTVAIIGGIVLLLVGALLGLG